MRCLASTSYRAQSLHAAGGFCKPFPVSDHAYAHTGKVCCKLPTKRQPLRDCSVAVLTPERWVATPEEAEQQPPAELEDRRWSPEDYAGLWHSVQQEDSYEIEDIEGSLPPDLEGTFYRNGPGVFEIGGAPMHVFDGHGLIARVAIRNGHAHFRSRFVRTQVYEEETRRGKVLYRGFGTQKPGGVLANMFDIRDKPVANTALAEWGGKLWALWEAHRPYVLDPDTLETLGEDDLGGLLWQDQPFCAHPQPDPTTGNLVAFSLGLRHAEGKLHVFEIAPSGEVVVWRTLPISMLPPTYIHDFQVTKSWYIFFKPPLAVDFGKFGGYLLGLNDQTQMVRFDTSASGKWILVPRDGGQVVEVETPAQFIWHYAAAVEDEVTGKLTVDACVFDEFAPGAFDVRVPATIGRSTLCRCEIYPVARTASRHELSPLSADLPRINPAFAGRQDYRYVYMAASSHPLEPFPYQQVTKVDVSGGETSCWQAPPGCFVGEAIFVPRPSSPPSNTADRGAAASSSSSPAPGVVACTSDTGSSDSSNGAISTSSSSSSSRGDDARDGGGNAAEDDGYLVTLVYDGQRDRSSLLVLDAVRLEAGPIAQLHLKRPLPFAFHCHWSRQCHGLGG